jgi:flagellar biosynthetic protein FliR
VAPVRARVALIVMSALAVHGIHPMRLPTLSLDVLDWALLVLGEFLLGVAMGFVVRMAIAIAEIAAEAVAMSVGLSAAQIFDPHSGAPGTALTQFFRYLTLLLLLTLGIHRVLLGSVFSSFSVLPIGRLHSVGSAAPELLNLAGVAVACGVRIALPVVALLFMTQIALAFVSRAAPAMQIFSVGFAVTLAVGALILILALPDLSRQLAVQLSNLGLQIEDVIAAIIAGGAP